MQIEGDPTLTEDGEQFTDAEVDAVVDVLVEVDVEVLVEVVVVFMS